MLRRHHISFKNAFGGICWAFRTQPNFRVHIFISVIVLFAAYLLRVSVTEITLLLFTILLGLTAEMINTSIEAVTDLVTSEWHKDAKIAKDVSAGMMLLVAFGAIVVAVIVFGPKIIRVFQIV